MWMRLDNRGEVMTLRDKIVDSGVCVCVGGGGGGIEMEGEEEQIFKNK